MRTSYLNQRSSGIWDWAAWAFCWVCFCCPCFQHARLLVTSTVLGFHYFELSQYEFSSVLGLCLMGAKPRLLQPGYIPIIAPDMSGECEISSVLSHHNKTLNDGPQLSLLQLRVLFKKQRTVYPSSMRVGWPQRRVCRVHHTKCWAEWITNWNQDSQEKYQQPQISRW